MKSDAVFDIFGKHSINICISYTFNNDNTAHYAVYSGSVLNINNLSIFLTAGHVLDEISTLLNDSAYAVIDSVIMDTISSTKFGLHPIPISLRGIPFYSNVDDELGIDVGFFEIHDHYVRLMRLNEIVPITENEISDIRKIDFDALILLGSPAEYVNQETGFGECRFEPSIISIPKNSPFVGHIKIDTLGRLTALTSAYDTLHSVKGMSGGPIFGIKSENKLKYWLVGLLSSEKRDTRKIFAETAILSLTAIKCGLRDTYNNWKQF